MKRSRSRNNVDVAASTCVIVSPLQSSRTAHQNVRGALILAVSGAPQPPSPALRNAQPLLAEAKTERGWLTNSTFGSFRRDETTAECDESLSPPRFGGDSSKFNLLCGAARAHSEVSRWRIFRSCLAPATFGSRNGAGPRRPNAARALCKES